MPRSRRWGLDLYIIQQKGTGYLKVGRSGNVEERLKQLQTGSATELRIILHVPNRGGLEKDIHRRMSRYKCWNRQGEWFEEPALAELPVWLYDMLDLDAQDWWITS